ncbi:unnamed protein product [Strongylus vulgaris]|uniref:Coronin-7 n=1 Tax=Strongylus vulgaris TaxID=40348 RepID=A0A3P7JF90_STRVU|nr:unnamed protein product [Strongylus vulgaris]
MFLACLGRSTVHFAVEASVMAWRFQASKFKNTTPHIPKREDTIFDVPVGNLSCTNNGIQASASYLAFHVEGEVCNLLWLYFMLHVKNLEDSSVFSLLLFCIFFLGGKLGLLPIGAKGRRTRKDMSIVCAHGEQVDDFCFMTFNDDLLLTCSRDDNVKVWRLLGEEASPICECELSVGQGHVLLDALRPHSTAANIIAAASLGDAYIIDLVQKTAVITLNGFEDKGQSIDWSEDGKLLAISADKGRQVYVYDVRSGSSPVHNMAVHQGMGRESRRPLFSNYHLPLLDFLQFLVYEMSLTEQNLGACLGNKRNVNVMSGEVDIFYQLTKHSILPVPCIVPRRSYRDFHADLFPDTRGTSAGCSSTEWLKGSNALPSLVSLAPNAAPVLTSPPARETNNLKEDVKELVYSVGDIAEKENEISDTTKEGGVGCRDHTWKWKFVVEKNFNVELSRRNPASNSSCVDLSDDHFPREFTLHAKNKSSISHHVSETITDCSKLERSIEHHKSAPAPEPPIRVRQINNANGVWKGFCRGNVSTRTISARVRPKSCVVGQLASKYRHVETLVGPKANNAVFSNLRNVNTQLPLEANGACVSGKFVAVPLKGPAGVIGIYDVDMPCKIPDGVMDGIFNKALVTDLHWNPFDDEELAVSLDVGLINFWRLTKFDGPRNEMEPEKIMSLGGEKVLCFQWHPLASDLMAIALSDSSIEIWECKSMTKRARIVSHSAPVLALAWSFDGHRLASIGKDLMLNVHQPQLGSDCLIAQQKVLNS